LFPGASKRFHQRRPSIRNGRSDRRQRLPKFAHWLSMAAEQWRERQRKGGEDG
jgi:hypothetical protein